ncbi:type II toxin-antitoxin system RelE/ParE family toxin [Sphingomonas sp. CROZ-RG-20F-R02-07]|uniref:type II toxin-antitoxin system RelE/ParE family toxin n=1 Tax=Sphingomonas sp. CROZ-RG-20F-R02-07 TaxID=2914832 RepID=UPI001F595561|nr:type II toxin-antitoxin system RelE/ParE family toxin [Sphingomonas sp. CROZ-RG-20F-R02-07]
MRRVIWSNSARDDYFAVLRHVAQDDADAAERIVSAIEQVGNGLADFATGHPGRVAGTYEKTGARLAAGRVARLISRHSPASHGSTTAKWPGQSGAR